MAKKKIIIKPKANPKSSEEQNTNPKNKEPRKRRIRGITPIEEAVSIPSEELSQTPISAPKEDVQEKSKLKFWIALGIGLSLIIIGVLFFLFKPKVESKSSNHTDVLEIPKEFALLQRYNIDLSVEEYGFKRYTSDEEMDMKDFLTSLDLKAPDVRAIKRKIASLGIDKIGIGDVITSFFRDDYSKNVEIISIEPREQEEFWYLVDISDDLSTQKFMKPVEYKTKKASCVIAEDQFLESVYNCDLHIDLIPMLGEILKWSVDLYHIEPGDKFKIVYDEKYVDDRLIGIEKIDAIEFHHHDRVIRIFGIDHLGERKFFDDKGRSLERKFLLSPLQYGRISSHFNPNRKHPVTGQVKRHGGTDYAAAEGTPILTVADGRVTGMRSTRKSGRLIEITHDSRYKTKYLHCSEYKEGIRIGDRVRQGEVIAYVGQTGEDITGAHVCFRFLKDGDEVDHLKENLPTGGNRISGSLAMDFEHHRDSLDQFLFGIDW